MIAFKSCHNQRKYEAYFVMLHKDYEYLTNQSIILKSVDADCRKSYFQQDIARK